MTSRLVAATLARKVASPPDHSILLASKLQRCHYRFAAVVAVEEAVVARQLLPSTAAIAADGKEAAGSDASNGY